MRAVGTKVIFFVLLAGLLFSMPETHGAAAPPGTADFQRQASRCRDLLRRTVFDFYYPGCLDTVHAGYLEDWKDGKFVVRGEKFLTLQARQLWFFSTMATENFERAKSLEAAAIGYLFLEQAFRDPRWGGYISSADDLGKPLDTRKHIYHNSFVLYALSAYYQATRDSGALKRAQELFRVLEQHAHDVAHGGFGEFFYADWRPVTNLSESGYVGAIGTKTYNTHLHLLESFTALYRVWPDPLVRARVEELLRINTVTVQHPVSRCNIDGWTPDWHMIETPANLHASYGHDVECTWIALDAARTLGYPLFLFRGWAESLANHCLTYGYDADHGGFFYTGPLGGAAADTRKEWWVEAEGLVGMLELYRLTGDPRYYSAFVQTLDFIEQHQVAPDGGWFATRNEDGTPSRNLSRSSMWQGAYHNGRALLYASRILSTLKPPTH